MFALVLNSRHTSQRMCQRTSYLDEISEEHVVMSSMIENQWYLLGYRSSSSVGCSFSGLGGPLILYTKARSFPVQEVSSSSSSSSSKGTPSKSQNRVQTQTVLKSQEEHNKANPQPSETFSRDYRQPPKNIYLSYVFQIVATIYDFLCLRTSNKFNSKALLFLTYIKKDSRVSRNTLTFIISNEKLSFCLHITQFIYIKESQMPPPT